MKKIIYLILIITISNSAYSQKSLIDERNGFKTIKLGSQKSNFDNLTLFQTLDDVTAYRYYPNDRDLYKVFDNNYEAIILYFDKNNSLVMIMLAQEFRGNNFYENAMDYTKNTMDKFVRVFGKYDEVDTHNESGDLDVTWFGDKTYFSVGWIYFGIAKGKAESHLIIGKTEKLSSGF